jgi:hypothetical protein
MVQDERWAPGMLDLHRQPVQPPPRDREAAVCRRPGRPRAAHLAIGLGVDAGRPWDGLISAQWVLAVAIPYVPLAVGTSLVLTA